MFIVNLSDGSTQQESKASGWKDMPSNIKSAYLFHPGIKLSVGLHDCQEYAFFCEGVAMIANSVHFPRIAEHLIGRRGNEYCHIALKNTGSIEINKSKTRPELETHIWKEVKMNGS